MPNYLSHPLVHVAPHGQCVTAWQWDRFGLVTLGYDFTKLSIIQTQKTCQTCCLALPSPVRDELFGQDCETPVYFNLSHSKHIFFVVVGLFPTGDLEEKPGFMFECLW